MAKSFKAQWLEILTDLAKNCESEQVKLEAIKLAIYLRSKNPKSLQDKNVAKELKSIFGSQKMAKPQDEKIKPDSN